MTLNIRTILVPVDFGAASARAISVAGRLAPACDARMQLLHAESLDLPPYFTAAQIESFERERQVARAQAHDVLSLFAAGQTTSAFSTAIAERSSVDAILDAAKTSDFIVMGTHGRRGVSRWWLGSVAERVVRESARPVLVVHEQSPESWGHDPLILVGTDTADSDAPERQFTQRLATCLGGHWAAVATGQLPEIGKAEDAAIIVVRTPWPGGSAAAIHQAEQMLQGCTRPILFVPPA